MCWCQQTRLMLTRTTHVRDEGRASDAIPVPRKESDESFEMVENAPGVASSVIRDNVTQDLEPLISSLSQLGQDMFKVRWNSLISSVFRPQLNRQT